MLTGSSDGPRDGRAGWFSERNSCHGGKIVAAKRVTSSTVTSAAVVVESACRRRSLLLLVEIRARSDPNDAFDSLLSTCTPTPTTYQERRSSLLDLRRIVHELLEVYILALVVCTCRCQYIFEVIFLTTFS